MDTGWTTIVDIMMCSFILFFLIGQRFNQWPDRNQPQLSGKPSDYIDPFRYWSYYAVYISSFLVVGLAIYNLELAVPETIKTSENLNLVLDKLGRHSWTMSALYLLALVNEKHVNEWESKWRNRLQIWARIPKAVMDMKSNILFSEDSLTPNKSRLDDLRNEMKRKNLEEYWGPRIDAWEEERRQCSLEWLYLKAMYTLRICKQFRVSTLSAADITLYEKRLVDLGYILPKFDAEDENLRNYADELNELFGYCMESLSKHLIQKNPSKHAQHDALRNLGFHVRFSDVTEIRIFGVAACCLMCIVLICIVTIYLYLNVLDWVALPFRDDQPWFSWDRLYMWGRGSIFSYGMAIFVAIIIDRSREMEESQPRFITHMIALLFSTLVSLSFFHFTARINLDWFAYVSLALSMGVVSIAVIQALTKSTCNTRKEVWLSAASNAFMLGLLAGVFQAIAAVAFRGSVAAVTQNGLIASAAYGFVKGALVVFVVSFLIQESIRKQLILAQRTAPRVRYKTRIDAVLDNESFTIITRDISRGGMRIEPKRLLRNGQQIDLQFPSVGLIQAKVLWVTRKFAGLEFVKKTANVDELYQYIRTNFGLAYA
jgi:hypothetical protein